MKEPDYMDLQRERDENLRGVKPRSQERAYPPRNERGGVPNKCRACGDRRLAICTCCINFPICEDKSDKPHCWVGNRCLKCKGSNE